MHSIRFDTRYMWFCKVRMIRMARKHWRCIDLRFTVFWLVIRAFRESRNSWRLRRRRKLSRNFLLKSEINNSNSIMNSCSFNFPNFSIVTHWRKRKEIVIRLMRNAYAVYKNDGVVILFLVHYIYISSPLRVIYH